MVLPLLKPERRNALIPCSSICRPPPVNLWPKGFTLHLVIMRCPRRRSQDGEVGDGEQTARHLLRRSESAACHTAQNGECVAMGVWYVSRSSVHHHHHLWQSPPPPQLHHPRPPHIVLHRCAAQHGSLSRSIDRSHHSWNLRNQPCQPKSGVRVITRDLSSGLGRGEGRGTE